MTAIVAGAPSGMKTNWNQVNWGYIRAQVNQLQMRIAKATRENRWGKVRALQHLLTHSFYGKLLAVKRVISNKGAKTPGIDGKIWRKPSDYWYGALSLSSHGYRAQPLRRIYIPKSNGKLRPLGIPTIFDRAMQALYALALKPVAETTADSHSYGFREKRSLHDAVKQCFISLATKVAAPSVLDADITACFDKINHQWLLDNIPLPKRILKQWLACGYIEQSEYFETKEGSPQGGIISPILANMTLDGLQGLIQKGLAYKKRNKLNVIRYADDFVVTGKSESFLRDEVLPDIEQFLKPRGLTLSVEKTHVRSIQQGFDFLGFNIRKYKQKLLIKPSHKKVKRFMAEIKLFLKQSKGLPFQALLFQLNRKLRGWANSNRQVVTKDLFGYLDNQIYRWINRWLRQQHRSKTQAWIKRRYWQHRGGRYNIGCNYTNKYGLVNRVELFKLSDVPIRYHNKIRANANPYDPQYDDYFKQRKIKQARNRAIDRRHYTTTPLERLLG